MIKTISIIVGVLLVSFVGWEIWLQWEKYDTERDVKDKEAEAAAKIVPENLQGMPQGLEQTYAIAKKRGAVGVRDWLRAYGQNVQDPRRAWIELDYVVLISGTDPGEAKKVFAEVKNRTPDKSPVSARIKELARNYE
ncbi:MAG: hypothetical protein JWR26_2057 [Pedosphaera sp.]|nr:hypothetical protein [Pedosphaera sp.]